MQSHTVNHGASNYLSRSFLFVLFGRSTQLCQELTRLASSTCKIVPIARLDLRLQPFILLVQVILKIVDMHDADYGDAIFLKNEVLTVHVSPPDHLPKVDASFR